MFTKFCIERRLFGVPLRYIIYVCGRLPRRDCQTHQNLRAETSDIAVRKKLYSPVENLQRTATYVIATGVFV